ncbi:S-adenosyl-L-methionine-dependent methyltransferase [Hypoxylon argillaceum]|nr:S-adenosyl-L-methionine-dependent methyltransferase [Hypoxylon argillaceum]KAI1149827.1 S-adenosyl-L-methionine-dependent methyltransferase [Nemania diffusa]
MAADFEKQSYWHDRFATETAFEWLVPSETFMPFLTPYLYATETQRILHLGPGTSDLHTHLRARGHANVTNADYEPLALTRGRALEEAAFGDVRMSYAVADVTKLDADLGTFDLVVDKSTADAVSCGGDAAVLAMARCVRACLAPDGVWVSLSYSATRFELEELPFEVRVVGRILTPKAKVTDPDVFYWCYLLRPR